MGITVHYRGTIKDLDRVEDFEDRVLDLALEIGAMARVWRTGSKNDPDRMVRGLVVDLAPGQESTSLLISPEGWLVGLHEIEDAEEGRLDEAPWCWVKTQFGPVEGHVTLIELLDAIKREYIPDLEVHDEAEYWNNRDVRKLADSFARTQAMIDGLAEGLQRTRLSSEAAEDPEIVAKRIERIAQQVHRILARPPEHPPVRFTGGDSEFDADEVVDGTEAEWDAMEKHNRRRQEHMEREIEERLQRGEDFESAYDNALRSEGLGDILDAEAEARAAGELDEPFDVEDDDEAWVDESDQAATDGGEDDIDDAEFSRPDRHPLQRRSMDLMFRLDELFKGVEERGKADSTLTLLFRSAGEIMGGLAQALSRDEELEDLLGVGLSIVQLKRSLRGAAFAGGALFPLRSDGLLDEATFKELHDTIRGLETDIFAELARFRAKKDSDD